MCLIFFVQGKLRIREISSNPFGQQGSTFNINNIPRKSVNPALLQADIDTAFKPLNEGPLTHAQYQMTNFNLNEHQITIKCRLYLIKAILYRGWDASGKADPFIKIALNDTTIIDDAKGKLHNTLEPVFGK